MTAHGWCTGCVLPCTCSQPSRAQAAARAYASCSPATPPSGAAPRTPHALARPRGLQLLALLLCRRQLLGPALLLRRHALPLGQLEAGLEVALRVCVWCGERRCGLRSGKTGRHSALASWKAGRDACPCGHPGGSSAALPRAGTAGRRRRSVAGAHLAPHAAPGLLVGARGGQQVEAVDGDLHRHRAQAAPGDLRAMGGGAARGARRRRVRRVRRVAQPALPAVARQAAHPRTRQPSQPRPLPRAP